VLEHLLGHLHRNGVWLGIAGSVGRVDSGYVADLVLLEANPLADIRDTRRIAGVIDAGFVLSSATPDTLPR